MPVYPNPKNPKSWRVTLYLNGKQSEWIVKGTRAEAENFEAEKRLTLSSRPDPRTAPSLRDYCVSIYKPYAKQHLKASTWETSTRYQLQNLLGYLGPLKLADIGIVQVDAYKAARAKDKNRSGGTVGPTTINNELRLLGTVLRHAQDRGYLKDLPRWRRIPVRGKPRAKAWTVQQVQALYTTAQTVAPELVSMLAFMVNTGCRKGEVIACEWSWVDFDAGMLRIPSNKVWQPKNGKPREIPLPSSLERLLFARWESEGRHPTLVFPNRAGTAYSFFPEQLFRDVKDAAKVVGTPHWTRHTFASLFLRRTPDLFLLAQVMGHSHVRVTELYTHFMADHLDRARNAVDLAPLST